MPAAASRTPTIAPSAPDAPATPKSVQVTFDPHVISLGKILQIYFSVAHDPTQIDGQEPDMGPQYRSEIFAQDDTQRKVGRAYIAQLDAAKVFSKPIATKIGDGQATFYPAEDYHQDYATKHPSQPYIAHFDLPKIEHLKQLFPERISREAGAGGASQARAVTGARSAVVPAQGRQRLTIRPYA